jgi:intracellular septation protein A
MAHDEAIAVERADGAAAEVTRAEVLLAVARRGLPHIVEATVAPAVLFFVCLELFGLGAAFIAALGWSHGAVLRRWVMRQPVPPLLVLASLGLTVRTIAAVASNSSFVYFIQPVLGTAAMALVFVGSIVVGRPLIARMAHDFCPLSPEVVARPGVALLFRRLTILWAGVNLVTASTNLVMLQTMSLNSFVAAKTLTGWGVTTSAVVLTVADSVRTARREGLLDGDRGHALVGALATR